MTPVQIAIIAILWIAYGLYASAKIGLFTNIKNPYGNTIAIIAFIIVSPAFLVFKVVKGALLLDDDY